MNSFMEEWQKTVADTASDAEVGLNPQQVEESQKKYGVNCFTKEKPPSFMLRVWEAMKEPMTILLVVAALITLAVNIVRQVTEGKSDFLECVGIFVAIFLSIFITVIMEGKSAKAFEALSKIGEGMEVRVIRGGETMLIQQSQIVVGDILLVGTGDKLPADGRLIESVDLQVDESALTGESAAVNKNASLVFDNAEVPLAERKNMVYSGCFVTRGNGKIVITNVGDTTEFGKIAKELSTTKKESTPLQQKLAKLGKTITILGGSAAALVFIIQLITFLVNGTATFDNISNAFITSIVLVVASVPEGMPTIVAVALAINIIKMAKQNALVKKMVACETVGCINIICSDKTGTLTENRMTVTDIYSEQTIVKPDLLTDKNIINNFCINSTADVSFNESAPQFIGNPTECALLVAANKAGIAYKELRVASEVAHVFPFTSEKKAMTTIVKNQSNYVAYTKGSPEKILALCAIDADKKARAEEEIIKFQKNASRVIGFCHREFSLEPNFEESEVETDMIFDGFVAISDPLRKDVLVAVQQARSAGISLKMLTGDNIITARAIAEELGILEEGFVAVEARELDALSDEELSQRLPSICVIARSTPSIKMRVVKALKAMGNIVAVTGDGINDAPAIKNADVGVSMGISGTEVTKAASDIVLLDDSFSTIVKSVKWGRGIYENFQRFIQFQLTVNFSSVLVVLCSIIVGFASPFSALQLLWINIVMDGPPALTLGLEPIRDDLMLRSPTRRDANIVTKKMLSKILFNGAFVFIIFMCQSAFNFLKVAPAEASTVLFTLFVVFQLFNAFNCRELDRGSVFKNLAKNKMMLVVFLFTFGLQVVITQFGGAFFGTTALSFMTWLKIVGLALSVVAVSEVAKLFEIAFLAILSKRNIKKQV